MGPATKYFLHEALKYAPIILVEFKLNMPFFSICIPAYKNTDYLKRLLDSILVQTFTNYEVVITDDSPGDVIEVFLKNHYPQHAIRYFKNPVALGTPENWNEGIRRATGDWIKLMHDDDWFCTSDALKILFNTVQKHPVNFYFSAYNNIFLDEQNRSEVVTCPPARWNRVLKYPPNLYARNIIGPPSVTLVKNFNTVLYDNRMKWLVDIDYYIRLMNAQVPVYIKTPLVNVGMGSAQVTTYTHNKPEVEIPEGLLLLSKLGEMAFYHILYFDAWWRLFRNVGIRRAETLDMYAGRSTVPAALYRIISLQQKFPVSLLRIGLFSKSLMIFSWLHNRISSKFAS